MDIFRTWESTWSGWEGGLEGIERGPGGSGKGSVVVEKGPGGSGIEGNGNRGEWHGRGRKMTKVVNVFKIIT